MAYWLKLGYFTDSVEEEDASYWKRRRWISDGPGRHSSRWEKRSRPRKGQRNPPFGPKYKVGDRLVIYVKGRGCPAILEVREKPYWDPGEVDARASTKEGSRWGVVTKTKCLESIPLSTAPTLKEIGVEPSSVMQKGHIALQEWQYKEAEKHIAPKRQRRKQKKPGAKVESVPLEKGSVEGYDQVQIARRRKAERREKRLVEDFADYLEKRENIVERNKILPSDTKHPIYTDLFNATRKQLIEAKAGRSRGEIRMAIGQLADYSRFLDGLAGTAVLLGAMPEPDLRELLKDLGIALIVRDDNGGFTDDAEGAFT